MRNARSEMWSGRIAQLVSQIRYHMKILLAIAAVSEAATGIALLAYPPIVIRLLLGAEVIGIGDVVSRFGGIGLIGLGVACWPSGSASQALDGMLTYGTLAALYLAYIGVSGQGGGVLLWPAVVVHALLIILLLGVRSRQE
jgi:hypothetical protein